MSTITTSAAARPGRRLLSTLTALTVVLFGVGAINPSVGQTFDASGPGNTVKLNTVGSGVAAHDGLKDFDTNFDNAANPEFTGNSGNFGSFDRSTGSIDFKGGEAHTTDAGTAPSEMVSAVYVNYSVTRSGQTAQVNQVQLTLDPSTANASNKRWTRTNNSSELVRFLLPGTYTFSVYFSLRANGPEIPGTTYTTTFTVYNLVGGATQDATGTQDATLTFWTGNVSTSFFDAGNWTNGIPNDVPAGTAPKSVVFPIGTQRQLVTPAMGEVFPAYAASSYSVQNMTVEGSSAARRAQPELRGGTFNLFGNFSDPQEGLIHTAGTFVLAGGAQTIGSGTFFNLKVTGGGNTYATRVIKTVPLDVTVNNLLTFTEYSMIETDMGNLSNSFVDLGTSGSLVDESYNSYVFGTTKAQRNLTQGVMQTFGDIGLDVTADETTIGAVVFRYAGTAQTSLTSNVPSISRTFRISPGTTSLGAATTTVDAQIVFHYFGGSPSQNNPQSELNGNTESALKLFRRAAAANTFFNQGGVVAFDNTPGMGRTNFDGTVTATSPIPTARDFTLSGNPSFGSDPLPVTLTAFAAKRTGAAVVLNWNTATELNNKGYDIQVSSDAHSYRSLGFVASTSPNSTSPSAYQFVDDENNKAGTRYYRLRQVDLNGKETFYGPRVITFGSSNVEDSGLALAAYPNPFTSNVSVTLASDQSGQAHYTLTDLTGRVIRKENVTTVAGTNEVTITGLDALKAGMYMVRFTAPSGLTESVKVQKL